MRMSALARVLPRGLQRHDWLESCQSYCFDSGDAIVGASVGSIYGLE